MGGALQATPIVRPLEVNYVLHIVILGILLCVPSNIIKKDMPSIIYENNSYILHLKK